MLPDNPIFNREETLASPHYNTCTHPMDQCWLLKDAEGVAVFYAPQRKVLHYSVRIKDWYMCKVISGQHYFNVFEKDPQAEMEFIQSLVREAKSIQ